VLYAVENYSREPRPRRRMDAASDGNRRTMKTGGEGIVQDATVNERSVDAPAKGLATGAISRRRAEMQLAPTSGIMVLEARA
jgi:hypothetical protein